MSLAASTNPVVVPITARDTGAADAGSYYVGLTPTPGTGIIGGASVQAFTETTPYLVLYNGGSLNIYPTYLRMHTTVIGATASVAEFWTNTLDTGNRFSSGGTALAVANTNSGSTNTSKAVVTVGAITATAATSTRKIVSHQASKFVTIETVHDTIHINWGAPVATDQTSLINNAASLCHTAMYWAPVVIAPGYSMVLVRWAASQTTGSTLEVEMGWIEK